MSRPTSIRPDGRFILRNVKMLCPKCQTVEPVLHQNEFGFFLNCRHTRTVALLPSHQGCISLEHLLAGDKRAVKLFPFADEERRVQSAEDIEITVLLSEADALGKVA